MAEGIVIGNLTIPVIKGDKGDKGDTGEIISISLVLLSPSSTAYAINNGSTTQAQIELGIPKGLSVSTTNINASGELVFTFNDNSTVNVGQVVGKGISEVTVTDDFDFVVTYTDGTSVTACNLEDEVLGTINDILESYYTKTEIDEMGFITKEVNNLTNYTLKTSTGSSIELSINTTTYVMTLNLKNASGTVISTGTVDLPLETMVVGATYDNTNKKIVLTLKNGTTIDVPVADLVSGLQSEITNANKLSADLVDDTSTTHKFTSTSEKNSWNAKYDKPSGGIPSTDMSSSVQTSLGKADTALQAHQDISGKEDSSNKVTSIDENSTNTQYPSAKVVYDELVERDEEINQLYNDHPDITDTGTDLTLNGTGDLKMKVDVGGNSTQETTSTSEGDEYDSPSPEHKQDINNVEGDVVVKAENKNYLSTTKNNLGIAIPTGAILSLTDRYCQYGKIEAGFKYTISRKNINNSSYFYYGFYDKEPVVGILPVENKYGDMGSSNLTYTTPVAPSGAKYLAVFYGAGLSDEGMAEKREISTLYVPHAENTVTFPLSQGQKLMLGDTLEDDGIHHKRTQTTFTGTTATLSNAKINGAYLCDQKTSGNLSGQTLTFDSAVTNAIIEYELATETIDPYTAEQQEAYNKLKEMQSYYDLTYVVGSSNNAQPILTVQAKKSLKVINDEISNINSRLTLLEE